MEVRSEASMRRDGDRLMTQATGQQEFELFPSSATEFFNEAIGGRVTFVRDEASGEFKSFVLRQGGQEMTAKRVE